MTKIANLTKNIYIKKICGRLVTQKTEETYNSIIDNFYNHVL